MALNMKSLTQALAKTAAVIEQTVQSTVHEVTGPKALQDYELQEQVGSGGPALVWKLYAAKHRNRSVAHNQDVCVWFLDKKVLSESRQKIGLSKAAEDAFLDIIRADAMQMVRLRHPGVVHVVQGLEENKAAMTLVTEPIFASIANVLGHLDNISNFPKGLKGLELAQLEVKHGLLQLAETLSFLHNNARLVHRALSPEAIYITSSGAWKLAGFSFCVNVDQVSADSHVIGPAFHYPEYDSDDLLLPLQPPLNYTAPELTRSNASVAHSSADIFSLGCVAYHLLARQPLIDAKNNLRTYNGKVLYLKNESFSDIPPELGDNLRLMLNTDELSRPTALDFTGSTFFRDDIRLRAIRFLDHMLERDNMQKSDFLKALSGMWTGFDARVLRYKVLPPLCAELRNTVMQPMVLPMVLTIAESQEKSDFETTTLPALSPVLASASGDSLLLLVKHASLFINKVNPDQLVTVVVPMLIRAYDDPDARMQEEVLRRTLSIAKQLDFQVVKQTILPRLHNLALKTTVAAVRVNALLCLGELVPRLDKVLVIEILQTLRRCTAVDKSAPTLMCTLSVAGAVYKQYGVEFAAEYLLPLLSPLLVAQQLNLQQFAKYMLFIKEILRKIEEKHGVMLNNDGDTLSSSMGAHSLGMDNYKIEENGPGSSSTIKGNNASDTNQNWNSMPKVSTKVSWDTEDWSTVSKINTGSVASIKEPLPGNSSMPKSALLGQNGTGGNITEASNASLFPSFEWPPPILNTSDSSVKSQSSTTAFSTRNPNDQLLSNNSVLDGFDPFADWPPRTHTSSLNMESKSASLNKLSSIMNDGLSSGIPVNGGSQKKEIDIEGFFTSQGTAHSEVQTRKLAPPPTGLGKGRGRNPIRPIRSPQNTSSTPQKQPPLMDLL